MGAPLPHLPLFAPPPLVYSPIMQSAVLVFLGAGLGGVLRHILNLAIPRALGDGFPWATLFINVTGSFAMGFVVGWLAWLAEPGSTRQIQLFVGTGILGGYTTFSTFSLDAIKLIEREQIGLAALYIGGSVALGIAGLWAALALARSLA
jgi:CrcB protein